MPRPKKKRSVRHPPLFSDFKPVGIRRGELEGQELALDEFEAVRLADYMGLDHAESAERMEISRSTFSRLVEGARRKIALFLIEGKYLQIDGGDVHFRGNLIRCGECGHIFKIAFGKDPDRCPECRSSSLVDLAGGYGHGNCCRSYLRRQRG